MTRVETLDIPGVLKITPRRFADERGEFSETYSRSVLRDAGFDAEFVQDNQSLSRRAGTVRALHFQRPPHAQAKLVRVAAGAVLDVVVDIRRGSPSFGRHVAVELSAENGAQLLAPMGVAHGFVTLQADSAVLYKVSAPYSPACEGGVRWNDPALEIDWGVTPAAATVLPRDAAWPLLAELDTPFVWDGPA